MHTNHTKDRTAHTHRTIPKSIIYCSAHIRRFAFFISSIWASTVASILQRLMRITVFSGFHRVQSVHFRANAACHRFGWRCWLRGIQKKSFFSLVKYDKSANGKRQHRHRVDESTANACRRVAAATVDLWSKATEVNIKSGILFMSSKIRRIAMCGYSLNFGS